MKKYIISIIIIIILILASFLLRTRYSPKEEPKEFSKERQEDGHAEKENPNAPKIPYELFRRNSEKQERVSPPLAPGVIDFFPTIQKVLKEHMEMNEPVVIYGRVLDQEDKGISDVLIKLSTMRTYQYASGLLDRGRMAFLTHTDTEGRFFIGGFNAEDVSVDNLEKKGYISTRDLPKMYYMQNGSVGSWEDPVVFRMWLSKDPEPLIVADSRLNAWISADGTALRLDLLTGSKKKVVEPVVVSVQHNDNAAVPQDGTQKFDWSFTIEVPDGGVLLTDKEQAFFAPAEGYKPKDSFTLKKEDPAWSWTKELNVYIVTGQPPRYSRAKFSIRNSKEYDNSMNLKSEAFLEWELYTNPSGSRNLEYDPAKRINPGNNQ